MDTSRRQTRRAATRGAILDVAMQLLESEGYDGLQVRDVARLARTSNATIYQHFPSRDELVVAAVERWMESHVYHPLAEPLPEGTLYEALISLFRHIFEPWSGNPRMLEVFVRAGGTPAGERLYLQGKAAVDPVMADLFKDLDRDYATDIGMILTHVVYSVVMRFAHGSLAVGDILPTVERAIYRLTRQQTEVGISLTV